MRHSWTPPEPRHAHVPISLPNSLPHPAVAPCGWWLPNCSHPSRQYWSKPLSNGDVAVLLVNNDDTSQDLAVQFADIPLLPSPGGTFEIRDVHAHASLGSSFVGSFTAKAVASRDAAFLRFSLVSHDAI